MLTRPRVTVIVLNHNGLAHLDPCFKSLKALDYPREQVVLHLVDNGSDDDSVAFMMRSHPDVVVTVHASNLGFSEAVNVAVEAAETPFVAFLNNDTRVDPQWLTKLIDPLVRDHADCVGSRLIDWGGQEDLFEGGGCNFHGVGFQTGLHRDNGEAAEERDAEKPVPVLFACGAALAMSRSLFREVGGFDADYFAYYEDVDLGWRLWVLGYRVGLVPESIVYHHHSATAARVPIHKLRVLHIRNPILTILKNYADDALLRTLPAALLLSIKRTSFLANLDHRDFRIGAETAAARPPSRRWWRRKSRNAADAVTVPKVVMSDFVALEDVNRMLEKFLEKRSDIQTRRQRSDREIAPLFRDPFWQAEAAEPYGALQRTLVDFFGIDDLFAAKSDERPQADRPSTDRAHRAS